MKQVPKQLNFEIFVEFFCYENGKIIDSCGFLVASFFLLQFGNFSLWKSEPIFFYGSRVIIIEKQKMIKIVALVIIAG